ncbi:MAG: c-type cytochrome [Gemmataceae bacterium]
MNLRAAALRLLADRKSARFDAAYTAAVTDASHLLRAAARDRLADVDPAKAVEPLVTVLNDEAAPTVERQRAVATLSRLKGATTELDNWAEKLVAGQVPAELAVDVWDVLRASPVEKWKQLIKRYEARLPADPVGRFAISRTGGDAERGRDIFFNHTAAQCVRCHKIDGSGGVAGPELTGLVKRYPESTRDYILESLVKPSAKIAPGYAGITLTLLDGQVVAGTLVKEEKGNYEVNTADGKTVSVKAADIDTKTDPVSAMPAVDKALSHREVRDLIEYLMTLK